MQHKKLSEIENELNGIAKGKIWLFNSAGSFIGNVKFLFQYMYENRKDYRVYYISGDKNNVSFISSQGYPAVLFNTAEGDYLLSRAGVYVNEQCKEHYPEAMQGMKILNLYHGVGLKNIERKWDREFLSNNMIKKYIQYNDLYRSNMCFLVTSPKMEKHFKEQLDLYDDQLIRGGYPRNIYPRIKKNEQSSLRESLSITDEKVFLYAPTYRESSPGRILAEAFPNINQLNKCFSEKNAVLYIKLHPKIRDDELAVQIKENPLSNVKIWDDEKDVYEYFPIVDAAIIDYSSIYYDLLEAGVQRFIRYVFDYDLEKKFLVGGYEENTSGRICKSQNELMLAVTNIDFSKDTGRDVISEIDKIKHDFWAYSNENSLDSIIDQVNQFVISDRKYRKLYSFDIFDTVIHRRCGNPGAIFVEVQEIIGKQHPGEFPEIFYHDYARIRKQAENNQREYQYKCVERKEISFDSIFSRIGNLYDLSESQLEVLKKIELECEANNAYLDFGNYQKIQALIASGNPVILVSDMYLPKTFVRDLLIKVAPELQSVPIFISSELGSQKSNGSLYCKIYKQYSPWRYSEWVHTGDNKIADYDAAIKLGIKSKLYEYQPYNKFENDLVNSVYTSDAFKVANIFRKVRNERKITDKAYFCLTILSLIFVPYLKWVIEDAIKRNVKTLYFITRDGILLKKVADSIIKANAFNINTKLIYGSRKCWRLAGIRDKVEEDFFSNFGNFVGVDSKEKFYASIDCTEFEFHERCPGIEIPKYISEDRNALLREELKKSKSFQNLVLEKAKLKRDLANSYLSKNIAINESYAFVEFWGRGYTQTCLTNILKDLGVNSTEMYYYRSILPTCGGDIRLNYSEENKSLIVLESVFSNCGISTVEQYVSVHEKIQPAYKNVDYDEELFNGIDTYTKLFIQELADVTLMYPTSSLRMISSFAIRWLANNGGVPFVWKSIAHLKDSVELWGNQKEFAPVLTRENCVALARLVNEGRSTRTITSSVPMSLARSGKAISTYYSQCLKGKDKSTLSTTDNKSAALRTKLLANPELYCRDSKSKVLNILAPLVKSVPLVRSLVISYVGSKIK